MNRNFVVILIFWLMIFAGLTWYFQQKNNPVEIINDQGELILTQHANGHYITKGKINGFPVEFLVDTGASSVSISEQFAGQANLHGGISSKFYTASGIVEGRVVKNNVVELGPFKVNGLNVAVLPNSENQKSPKALLGQNFLRKFALKQQNNKLILRLEQLDDN